MSEPELQPSVVYRTGPITVADYDEAIEALTNARKQRASMEAGEFQPECEVCGDNGHTVEGCHHDPLALARRWTQARNIWTCFHCGLVCTTEAEAREHFGTSEDEVARCLRDRAAPSQPQETTNAV